MLHMGVTTMVGGNCGMGPADLMGYLDTVDRHGHPVNVALLAAHGSLRNRAGTFDPRGPVDGPAIQAMARRLDEELEAGAQGLSFGVRYIPGLDAPELMALCRVVRDHGGVVAAHVRDDAANVEAAIDEMMAPVREFGVKLQVSHIGSMAAFGQMRRVYALLDGCVAQGMDLGVDCYPYQAFCTSIGSATFDDGFLERYGVDYSRLELMEGPHRGRPCTGQTFRETRALHPEYLAVAHVMREEEVDFALAHPRTVVGSDGVLHGSQGHPRAAGAFPRFIREYALRKKLLTLPEAVAKMTHLTAQRFGLDRGTLAPGRPADITVFDPDTLRDTATFADPVSRPEGVKYVFIGGELALRDGRAVREDLGRAVRKRK
jgi:N-acyl-D-amino-acid deacylase